MMPPRRSHKKSRAGCRRCKNRKIKCDEVHPQCGNCVKHGVVCDFVSRVVPEDQAGLPAATPAANDDGGAPAATTSPAASKPPRPPRPPRAAKASRASRAPKAARPKAKAPKAKTPSPPPPQSPGALAATPVAPPQPALVSPSPRQVDRFLELRLLHHFTTTTSKTLFTQSPTTEHVWQCAVPQMAFDGKDYLMDAILSVAALHLRTQDPNDKALVRASHAYAASTLAEYCASLGRGITADNAEALFLTATLITFQSTASRIFAKDDGDGDGDGSEASTRYTLPMPWFHAFQGVKTIVASSWQWIRNSHVVKAVIDSQPSFHLDLNPRGPKSFFGHLLDGLDDELADESCHQITATSQAYSHAVSVLNWAHKNMYAPATLAFPASVSRRFVELVEEKRPRALAILCCFFALLKRMDNVWWLGDVARREVMGLVSLFESGSAWWRHLEWPVRIAHWDGSAIPSDVWGAECEEPPQADKGIVETMMSHIELLTKLTSQGPPSTPLSIAGDVGLAVAPLD